jgi:SAM-dependent methyltransferase
MADAWNQADPYEAYVGRWSRKLAPAFVAWAGVPPGARVLDVGCGTGALSEALLATRPAALAGFDLSPAYADEARRRLGGPRARFDVADARAVPVPDASFDAAISGLVLNFVPEPAAMVREMRRVLAPGGLAALYVWDYAGRMEMLRRFWDAAVALDPRAAALDEGVRFPVCEPGALRRLFEEAGFRDVETRALDQPTAFRGFDDYWSPFLGGQGPAPGYLASLEGKGREALREQVRASLPIQPDGSIPLIARAWAVKGRAPA